MADINLIISIITSYVIRLNKLKSRNCETEHKKKHDPSICCLEETHFSFKDMKRLKRKEQKYIIQTAIMESKSGRTNSRRNRL